MIISKKKIHEARNRVATIKQPRNQPKQFAVGYYMSLLNKYSKINSQIFYGEKIKKKFLYITLDIADRYSK